MRVEGRPGPAKGTRGLLALVVVLGLLIAVGTAVVLITILHRAFAPAPPREPVIAAGPRRTQVSGVLPVPPGTRIGGLAPAGSGDWLAVLLQGGGEPDRVVFVDPRDPGRTLGTLSLASPPAPARTAP